MRRVVVPILVAQLLGGCSFPLVSGPPANHRQLPVVECTTSRVGPFLDLAWTGLMGLNLLSAASRTEEEYNAAFDGKPPFKRSTAIGLYVGLGLLGAAGMYYGFTRTSACRSAKNEWLMRSGMNPQGPGPGTWPPPQQGPGTWPPPQQGPGTWPPPATPPAPPAPPAQPAPPAPPAPPVAPAPPAPAPPAPAPPP